MSHWRAGPLAGPARDRCAPRHRRSAPAVAKRSLAAAVAVTALVFGGGAIGLGPWPARAETPTGTIGGAALATTGVVFQGSSASSALPVVDAASFLVADLDTGAVLAAKSVHERLPPASTLKILTADVLLPQLDPATVYVGTDADVGVEGSKVGVDPGLTYTVDQLFQGMLLMSGNDAAGALARIAGGEPATVARMTERAAALQAQDTTVVNVTGLDAPGQFTSAYDLALIARDAMKSAAFRAYVSQRTGVFPGRDGGSYQIQNLNRLLGSYEGAIGIKTGFTTLARTTYVGAATRGGHTILVTVMHVEGRGETPAAALLDWAFAAYDTVTPVGTLVDPIEPHATTAAATPVTATAAPARPTTTPGVAARVSPDGDNRGVVRGAGALAGVLLGTAIALRLRARRFRAR